MPSEFWHTELLRESFAAQHMGRVSRAYRLHPYHHAVYGPDGITQKLLGQWLGLQQSQISRIETGPPIRDLDTLVYWARVLGVPARVLWFDMPGEMRQAAPSELESPPDPDAQRRAKAQAAVQQSATVFPSVRSDRSTPCTEVADHTILGEMETLCRDLDETIGERTITIASLDDWEHTVLHHAQATRHRAPCGLLGDLRIDIADLHKALTRCRSVSALRRLTRVTAQMSGLICLTLIKMDERTAFRSWARTARLAAQEAGDPRTHSWVRAQEAYGHYYSGNLTEAVHVAQHAQALSGKVPSVGAVLAAALEARAQAALGHEQETRAALGRAETCLSHLDPSAIGTSAFNYNEAQLRFHEGSAFTHLCDTNAAWQAQEVALSLCPASDYMDRTMTKLDRANCLAHDGDVAGAASVITEAATSLTGQQRQGILGSNGRSDRHLL